MPEDVWTTLRILNWTRGYLAERGIENSRLEAEWLLCAATGLDRVGLYMNFDKPLVDEELFRCRELIRRRGRREPLQYILGTQEFRGLTIEVTPDVLIPRHDTEVLVEQAMSRAVNRGVILDLCTGSGCVAIAIASELPEAAVCATDISEKALAVAARNAERAGVSVELLLGSFFAPAAGRTFDIVLSNPPYVASAELASLQEEVRHEPAIALDGGPDGLHAYRSIISKAPAHLSAGGWLILETGAGQSADVCALLEASGFEDIFTAADTAGIHRVAGGRYGC